MTELRTLLTGLLTGESARWHDGRLWFAHWGTREIVAVDLDGRSEVVGHGPPGWGWSIDWLPDGRLLTTGPELTRHEPDGSLVTHAELTGITDRWNEIVVDGRGNIYLNGGNEFHPENGHRPGRDRAGTAGRHGQPGRRAHRVPERHGGDARQFHPGDR